MSKNLILLSGSQLGIGDVLVAQVSKGETTWFKAIELLPNADLSYFQELGDTRFLALDREGLRIYRETGEYPVPTVHEVEVGTEIYINDSRHGGFHKVSPVKGPGYETHTDGEHWLMQIGAMLTSDRQKLTFVKVSEADYLKVEGTIYKMIQMVYGCTERRLKKVSDSPEEIAAATQTSTVPYFDKVGGI